MGEDARKAFRALKDILDAQERAIERLGAREVELQAQVNQLDEHTLEAEATAELLAADREQLLVREGALMDQVNNLRKELADTAERLTLQANAAEERARMLEARCETLQARADFGEQMATVGEKLRIAEERAQMFETRCNALQAKADHGDRLDAACAKLLEALDRLPLKMSEAGIIPGATRPEIELYGTYDWQQVMDAKFGVKQERLRKDE